MTHTPLRPAQVAGVAPDTGEGPRRRKWPWLAGGVLAVVAAGAGVYAWAAGSEQVSAAGVESQSVVASGVDGGFAFRVSKVECGVTAVGPQELPQRADGTFCLVNVSVTNAGKEPRVLEPGAQKGVDGQGREHAVADQAGVFLNEQTPSLLEEIAPGVTVGGVLAFDVPAGERLAAVVLHESTGSRGVRLPLS